MHSLKTLTLFLCGALMATTSFAQTDDDDAAAPVADSAHCAHNKSDMSVSLGGGTCGPVRHWYTSNALDGAIFGSAIFEMPGSNRRLLPTVRFSMVNFGYNFNYDFDPHFGFFTGLNIKNIGFIQKVADSTIKRRVYTLGIPVGFKLGLLQKRNYVFGGCGLDMPFNYREKGYVRRSDKQKFSEWFSDRTPDFMPYLFAGLSLSGSTLKLQYYPGNFFNPEFNETKGGIISYPYRGYSAHLICLSVGIDINYSKKDKTKKEEAPAATHDEDEGDE